MIKLVTIDIDDTLVNSAKQITPRVKAAVKAATAAGIKVVLTTGRPLTGVQGYLDELGLNHQDDQYVITYNGALVETTAGEAIAGKELSATDYADLVAWSVKLDTYLQVESLDTAYTTSRLINPSASRENYMVDMPLRVSPLEDMPADLHYVKCMFIGPSEQLAMVENTLPAEIKARFNLVKSNVDFLEVLNPQASKGNALATLAAYLDIPLAQTMALGDQANDLSMIKQAGLGVAMGNAIPEVKTAAKAVTTTQNEDGVGLALEKWALNQTVPELEKESAN
ncbi:Cof-type HAD-IIB family hydrolase [Weissella halotolerans]|uniref:HAD superfamily hydrolase n=1 Tax=Weissella halotolerans DSM 20190 TaxID=1123500 RepID=A0A0R2FRX1_9LACO|nr:Cof-type HAD-IIB family hydrolase [Weissella halotolerans]KRN31235.1 HAD superfamily hydrolase [Weissella halotolerans DSM 20190]